MDQVEGKRTAVTPDTLNCFICAMPLVEVISTLVKTPDVARTT